jgi:hypothetical protein
MDPDVSILGVKIYFYAVYLLKNILFKDLLGRSVTDNLAFI